MKSEERKAQELEIRRLCESGDMGRAIEVALSAYGQSIQKLMHSVLRDEELARDAYGIFCESLLTSLPSFRWESSFRTWAFRVARNACWHFLESPARREQP